MKLIIKTLAAAAVVLSLAGAAALSGCTVSLGEDGRDDVTLGHGDRFLRIGVA